MSSSKFHVLSGEFTHETNTFNINATDISNFEADTLIFGYDAIVRSRGGTRSGIGGVIEAAESIYSWTLSINAIASANPTGIITSECFESIVEQLLLPLQHSKVSGVLFSLHGSMVTADYPDAEGEILRRTRQLVGPKVPIIATLDLHANVTSSMAIHANALLACRTYPHVDFYETSLRAASILHSAMRGDIVPRMVLSKRPMLHGLDRGRTFPSSPMQTLIDQAEGIELTNSRVLCVSICAGFPASDIHDVGPSVTVALDVKPTPTSTSNPPYLNPFESTPTPEVGHCIDLHTSSTPHTPFDPFLSAPHTPHAIPAEPSTLNQTSSQPPPMQTTDSSVLEQGQKIAETFMDYCWEQRNFSSIEVRTVRDAVDQAVGFQRDHHPSLHTSTAPAPRACSLILAELTDNPGSGHYGDATVLLKAIVDALSPPCNLHNLVYYAIADQYAVQQCVGIGVGGSGWVEMGGRHDPTCGGSPLILYGKVVAVTDGRFQGFGPVMGGVWMNMGISVCFRVGVGGAVKMDTSGIGIGVRASDSDDTSNDPRYVDVCLTSNKQQALDLAQIQSLGIVPSRRSILVLKSMNHFKADFGALAERVVFVDGGGLGSKVLGGGGEYRNVRRPIWPLDAME